MAFLAEALPGFREVRSQIVGGYAWLLAAVIVIGGVPKLDAKSPLHDLVKAAGPVAIGAAVSLVAYLVGSLAEDAYAYVLGIRGGESLTSLSSSRNSERRRMSDLQVSSAHEPGADEMLEVASEAERQELDRLEARIDRLASESQLRLAIVIPMIISLIGLALREHDALWLTGFLGISALGWQTWWRQRRIGYAVLASRDIRDAISLRASRGGRAAA